MLISFGAALALVLGGLAGGLLARRRHRSVSAHVRSIDSDQVGAQAGWTNMHGS